MSRKAELRREAERQNALRKKRRLGFGAGLTAAVLVGATISVVMMSKDSSEDNVPRTAVNVNFVDYAGLSEEQQEILLNEIKDQFESATAPLGLELHFNARDASQKQIDSLSKYPTGVDEEGKSFIDLSQEKNKIVGEDNRDPNCVTIQAFGQDYAYIGEKDQWGEYRVAAGGSDSKYQSGLIDVYSCSPDKNYVAGPGGDDDKLAETTVHEIFHSLGLGHVDEKNGNSYTEYNGNIMGRSETHERYLSSVQLLMIATAMRDTIGINYSWESSRRISHDGTTILENSKAFGENIYEYKFNEVIMYGPTGTGYDKIYTVDKDGDKIGDEYYLASADGYRREERNSKEYYVSTNGDLVIMDKNSAREIEEGLGISLTDLRPIQ